MSHSSAHNGQTKLERVMQGILDTTLPDEDKERLLKRIQKEGGIYSAALRKELVDLFRKQQAEQEEIARDAAAQLEVMDGERAQGSQESSEEQGIAAEVIREQQAEFATLDSGIQAMKADVKRMDRNELEGEKQAQADSDAAEADEIRRGLNS
jgi:hypothetical protein